MHSKSTDLRQILRMPPQTTAEWLAEGGLPLRTDGFPLATDNEQQPILSFPTRCYSTQRRVNHPMAQYQLLKVTNRSSPANESLATAKPNRTMNLILAVGLFISRRTVGGLGVTKLELLHRSGVAVTQLRPSGTAFINGKRVDVVTEGPLIDQGASLKVVAVEGIRVVVREI
jgi:NfeD-like C-terminal, partner-binding